MRTRLSAVVCRGPGSDLLTLPRISLFPPYDPIYIARETYMVELVEAIAALAPLHKKMGIPLKGFISPQMKRRLRVFYWHVAASFHLPAQRGDG